MVSINKLKELYRVYLIKLSIYDLEDLIDIEVLSFENFVEKINQ